jgi:hypothetical protein
MEKRQLSRHLLPDQGVEDRFQLLAFVGVAEYQLPHLLTVKAAIIVQYLWAKARRNLLQGITARDDQLTGDLIAVDDRHTQFAKDSADGTLAAADTPGKTDAQHGRY